MTGGDAGPVRIAVIGCGAIGSLYAAHLARVPGVEVWAVDRWAELQTSGGGTDEGAPGLVSRTVDALLGVAL